MFNVFTRNYQSVNGRNTVIKMLEEPFKMCIDIEYDDLVGFHHKLNSLLMVKRFVHIRDEDNNVIENVLVINPYDSTIQNMTSIDS